MAVDAGDAFLDVIPRLRDFASRLRGEVAAATPAIAKEGQQAGEAIAKGIDQGTGRAGASLSGLSSRARSSLGAVSAAASTATGGLNPLAGALDNVSTGLAQVDKSGSRIGKTLLTAGLGATAFGAVLTRMGDESKRATAQLTTAIDNAGESASDFEDDIDRVSKRLIKLGFDDEATARSLSTLVTATGDTRKSLDLMGLAADIAAARHISLESATDKLAKAQTGNTRIFKEFGIELDANATASERAAAMAELQSRVQGQAAAQADNLTGRLKSVAIQAENIAEVFGEKAGPAITVIGPALAGVGGIIQSGMVPALVSGVRNLGLFAAAEELAGDEAVIMGGKVAASNTSLTVAGTGAGVAAGRFAGAGAGLVALAAGAELAAPVLGILAGQWVSNKINIDRYGDAAKPVINQLGEFGGVLSVVKGAWRLFHDEQERATSGTQQAAVTQDALATTIRDGAGLLDRYNEQQAKAGDEADRWKGLTDKAKAAVQEASVEVSGLTDRLKELLTGQVDADRALSGYEKSLDDLTDSLKENGTSLDLNSEAGRHNVDAIDDLVEAGARHLQSLVDSGASMDDLRGAFNRHIEDFRRTLTQMGFNEQQVDELTRKYGLVPENVNTLVHLHGAQTVLDQVNAIQREFSNLDGKTATLAVQVFGDSALSTLRSIRADLGNILATGSASSSGSLAFGGDAEPHAAGGDFAANRWLLVGEEGPEIVRFGQGGSVIPNDELTRAAPVGAALPPLTADAIGEAVARALRREPPVMAMQALGRSQMEYDRYRSRP